MNSHIESEQPRPSTTSWKILVLLLHGKVDKRILLWHQIFFYSCQTVNTHTHAPHTSNILTGIERNHDMQSHILWTKICRKCSWCRCVDVCEAFLLSRRVCVCHFSQLLIVKHRFSPSFLIFYRHSTLGCFVFVLQKSLSAAYEHNSLCVWSCCRCIHQHIILSYQCLFLNISKTFCLSFLSGTILNMWLWPIHYIPSCPYLP